MSLRLKLLLLALLTLVLPFAGCQYAREMESVLRAAEQQSLLAEAEAIATSLQGREQLLYRDGARVVGSPALDLEPLPLGGDPLVDGFSDDWPRAPDAWKTFANGRERLSVLAGWQGKYLYLLLEVPDATPVFDAPGADLLDPTSIGDRVWLAFDDGDPGAAPDAAQRQYFLATTGPGALLAHRIETLEYGRRITVAEPRIEAAWRAAEGGYRIEIRIPLSMIGPRFGVLLDDRQVRGATPVSLGSLRPGDLAALGRLVVAPPELITYLRQFGEPGVQLSVGSSTGALLAEVNVLQVPSAFGANGNLLAKLYRRFLDRGEALHAPDTEPGKVAPASLRAATTGTPTTSLARSVDDRRLIVAAAAPVFDASRHTVIGVVQVAQTAERWLLLRDHALTQLMNVTLAATALAVMGSFAFAARLGFRLARLRNATESALTREGRLETQLPDAAARDELGDVARSFGALLSQLDAYTAYLRTLAGKLAHEIRTPLTIVRSSLENLDNEALTDAARAYVGRAREGSERLGGILKAMGAASRVEEAIASADRVIFDVAPVVASAVEAYAQAFPARHFHLELPSDACRIEGAPELLVQLLDKLVENALDFSPEGAEIRVRLTHQAAGVQLDVENSGSRLPAGVDQRLFESLWQSRVEGGEGVHFGLGLYVARLIAEFHHGTIAASNLPGDGGVRIRLWIPLASG